MLTPCGMGLLSGWGGIDLVWTPDPSGHARKGLGNNITRKCLERWNAAVGVDEGKNTFQPTSVRVLLMTGSDIR